jgi:hypothetical protein
MARPDRFTLMAAPAGAPAKMPRDSRGHWKKAAKTRCFKVQARLTPEALAWFNRYRDFLAARRGAKGRPPEGDVVYDAIVSRARARGFAEPAPPLRPQRAKASS